MLGIGFSCWCVNTKCNRLPALPQECRHLGHALHVAGTKDYNAAYIGFSRCGIRHMAGIGLVDRSAG